MGDVARPYALTLAAVSKHLNVLEDADLIARQRRGSFQIVRLKAAALRDAEDWLAYYSKFWNANLQRLNQLLEEEEE